uniref:Fungal-type protein kinase domain-containing protein n=1 Tax=Schizophyllum commune (strain H4-8 / FGSC 9210) TaxID=578458 RepID=D8PL83_SCHCM
MGKENLECDRNRLLASARDSDKVRTCSVDLFWKTYAKSWRPLTSSQMNALTAALDEENVYRNKRWVALPDAKKGVAEDVHFKRLEKIFSKVTALAEKTLSGRFEPARRTTKFRCRPRQTTSSEVMGASHKVDSVNTRIDSSYPKGSRGLLGSARNAKIKIRRTGELVFTADALLTGEFKLFDTRADQFDNAKKTFGHAGHAFYNDVGRIVVFAYTIEGAKMRLWCHTRSHTGISEEFDIHTNPSMFIDFILFSTYASLPVLGVDTTVRRVIDSDRNIQYQFDFYDRKTNVRTTYETTRSIDESSAMELYSRSMRVFEVHLVLGDPFAKKRAFGKETFVLRDYYVFSHVKSEREIQGGIQHQLELKGVWEEAKPHFMRIREDGAVWIPRSEGAVRQTVPAPHEKSEPYEFIDDDNPAGSGPSTETIRTGRSHRTGQSSLAYPNAVEKPLSKLHEKRHMRTVYEQLCIDLYKVNDPKLFFFAMSQVAKILRYMKLAGYVHRDVSPGNFLLHYIKEGGSLPDLATISQTSREDWVTIISDLEYARPFLEGSGHDAITGTSFYVAVEVQGQRYKFGPNDRADDDNESDEEDSDWKNPHHFSYNPYHDAESALWMALDFVFRKIPSQKLDLVTGRNRRAIEVLREYSQQMFVPAMEGLRSSASQSIQPLDASR